MPSSFRELLQRWPKFLRNSDLVLTFGLFGTIFLLILPVPPGMLDMLLALSIGVALLILLVVLYVKDPPEFSVFPTLLLAITLFRLGLNVASTRLILLEGYAGNVINSFGNFVVQGNYVVGTVVFLILVIINFVVITKGSGRIAEVAARFTLDAMPGKQMAIDAELNAGIIDEKAATKRRMKIQQEADFYGAMDGASKFVRGDAVAGILITVINVIGGMLIGVMQRGMTLVESMQTYTLLSIGDGLVSQVPALILSVGAGILVTRSTSSSNLGTFIGRQLLFYPRATANLAVMMGVFAILPGMPMMPFLTLALGFGALSYFLRNRSPSEVENGEAEKNKAEGEQKAKEGTQGPPGEQEPIEKLIQVDTFAVELGYGLVPLADKAREGNLIERITGVRRTTAQELGVLVPPIAVRDNLELETNEYRFLLRQKEVARGSLHPNRWMAMNVSGSEVSLRGVPTVEPVFGLEAVWIGEEEKKTAEINGYTVVDAPSVLVTHLSETLREQAHALLEREDTQKLIDIVKEKNPTLVSELLPDLVNVGLIQRVLQNLLRERVSVRTLPLILESIADFASITKNADELTEQVRRRLGTYFVTDYEASSGVLQALTLDPGLEQLLISRVRKTQFEINLMLDPDLATHLLEHLQAHITPMQQEGMTPLLVTTSEVRQPFKRFFESSFPRLVVLAYQEIPGQYRIESAGSIPMPLRAEGASAELKTPEKPEAVFAGR